LYLTVNDGEFEFISFNRAVHDLSEEYGYQGLAWDMIVASGDFEILADFLIEDGLDAKVVY
jgi:hypothetical protein